MVKEFEYMVAPFFPTQLRDLILVTTDEIMVFLLVLLLLLPVSVLVLFGSVLDNTDQVLALRPSSAWELAAVRCLFFIWLEWRLLMASRRVGS